MSDGDDIRRVIDEIIRLKAAHQKDEVARLEGLLLRIDADLVKFQSLSIEAEQRSAAAEEERDRSQVRVRELERILARDNNISAAAAHIAEQEGVDDVEGFARLRARARKERRSLEECSAEVIAAYRKTVGRPRATPAAASGTPPEPAEPHPGHDACTVCNGLHQNDPGYPCRIFHELVDLYNDVSLHGAVFE